MITKSGKIITFYSYKGGTGRSMALSNIAWILSSNGYDVLLIDWDLEAPGLHRYLRPFLVDPELSSTPGLIDFVWDAARVNVTPADDHVPSTVTEFPSLEDYVVGLDWDFPSKGSISFIPAGRQDENYAQRVNTFDWDNFYARLGGGKLLQAEANTLRANYDYILIDSRTGVSDTAGICTVQMPDILAIFFTLNRQSIKGAAAVAASVRAQRDKDKPVPIYPVPTRIENGEQFKLKSAMAYAQRTFAPFLLHVQSDSTKVILDQQALYWHEVETPYISFYAFEEVPAAFMEERGSLRGVLAPTERIAAWLTDRRVSALQPESDKIRTDVVKAYEFTEDEEDKARKTEWESATEPQSRVGNVVAIVHRQLIRYFWQYATIAIAGLAVFLGVEWISNTLRVASLSSQISAFSSLLDSVNSQVTATMQLLQTAYTSKASPTLSDSDLIRIHERLRAIEENLRTLQSSVHGP
jgi:MinD-like ATPase involved in chromosome partitioning or flagellar assembly